MAAPADNVPPDDIKALKTLARQQQHQLAALKASTDAEIAALREQLNTLLAKRFGPSSEKVARDQLGLFNEAEPIEGEAPEAPMTEAETVTVPAHARKRPGRRPLPEYLPRVEREAADLTLEARQALRQARAGPLLVELRAWLDTTLPQVPPKSALGKALVYLHRQWPPARALPRRTGASPSITTRLMPHAA